MLTIPSIVAQAGVALRRAVSYDEVLDLARASDPVALSITSAAGSALGHFIAAVANLAMVGHIVVAGEGIGLLTVSSDEMRSAITADRDPDGAPIELLIDDSGFTAWARGAAAIAIQSTLDSMVADS